MRNKLLNLYVSNARKGTFKAEGNTIFIYDMIVSSELEAEYFGGVSAVEFTKTLAGMTGPVSLRINSPGGDVFAARAMAAAMKEYSGTITAYVDGFAASAASVIAVAANKCVMADGAFMMIHRAWTMTLGNAAEHTATANLLEKIDGSLAATYAAKSGKDAATYATMMAAETWFDPKEAIDAGLADEIAAAPAVKNDATKPIWDLGVYDKPPQDAVEVTVTVQVEVEDDAEEAAEPDETNEGVNTADPNSQDLPPASMAADETAIRARKHAVRMLASA